MKELKNITNHIFTYLENNKKMSEIVTKTEIKNGIKYTTHYIDRPIKSGDPYGGTIGVEDKGVSKTIEVINYIYKKIICFSQIGENENN